MRGGFEAGGKKKEQAWSKGVRGGEVRQMLKMGSGCGGVGLWGWGGHVLLERGCEVVSLSALVLAQFLGLRERLSSECGRLCKTERKNVSLFFGKERG